MKYAFPHVNMMTKKISEYFIDILKILKRRVYLYLFMH